MLFLQVDDAALTHNKAQHKIRQMREGKNIIMAIVRNTSKSNIINKTI